MVSAVLGYLSDWNPHHCIVSKALLLPHFADEATKAQRNEKVCLKPLAMHSEDQM